MHKNYRQFVIMFIGTGLLATVVLFVFIEKNSTSNAPAVNKTTANTNATRLSSTILLDDYHMPHLTAQEVSTLLSNIHQAERFITTQEFSLIGDCGQSANATIFQHLHSLRKVQLVNGTYPILRTPNLEHWTKTQADFFMSDPTVVCGAGFFYPFEVTPDYILWRQACSSGLLSTDTKGSLAPDFVQCLQAQEAISTEYKLQD